MASLLVALPMTEALSFIVGSGGTALRSTDNGLSWVSVDADTTEDLFDLARSNGVWMAVGASGTIRRSEDGGLTWSPVGEPISARSPCCYFF